jgi:acyl-CoA synthetase (AMP-forming)/AMP-acid ligase II
MRWIGPHGEIQDVTYADLDRQSSRFAAVLMNLGYQRGDVLMTYLPKVPFQYFALLGGLKEQMIAGPLFVNFGEDALLDRLGDSKAKIVVTRRAGWAKLQRIRERLPSLKHILLSDVDCHLSDSVLSLDLLMLQATEEHGTPYTSPDTPSLLHYTSGSTGKPKGVLHRHGSLEYQKQTGREILQLNPGDTYWCTADAGWVTGTSYGIIVPWSLGVRQIHFGGGFDPQKWFEVLEREKVNIWYTAPTALRMLMREEDELYNKFDLSSLRHIFSVGEPLNPEVIHWGQRVLEKSIHDTWFQTETGAIMISNRPDLPLLPGSMGKPVSGIEAEVLDGSGAAMAAGEKGGAWRTYFNLLLVFSVCGLWHGAAWNFIIWGALHGFFLAVELGLKKRFRRQGAGITGILSTFFLIMLGWVFFRTESIGAAWLYIRALFGLQSASAAIQFYPFRHYLQNDTAFYLICAAFFAWLPVEKFQSSEFWQRPAGVLLTGIISLGLIFFSALNLSVSGFNPFIYFRL